MFNSTADLAISVALDMYTDLGFDAIPLQADSKQPLARAWQRRSINRLWQDVPHGINIGLRAGGALKAAFLDCDETKSPGTFGAAQRWLTGLGYLPGGYPVVATASGVGRHIYSVLVDELPGGVRKLARDFGSGEFRYGPGGYVAAPPSRILGGNQYQLIEGDLRQLPHLEVRDVLPILGNQEFGSGRALRMSRKAAALLHGWNGEDYGSRSEADAALVASLVNSGYSFEAVLELFEIHPASGKYSELKLTKGSKATLHYLQQTYAEVLDWTQRHDSRGRRIAEAAIDWAMHRPWPGRTGAIDRSVFMAHMQLAAQAGRLCWAASSRDLAVLAGISSNSTASRSSQRLCRYGFIALQVPAIGDCANIFQLTLTLDNLEHSPSTPGVRKCASLSLGHDAFRYGSFGKSAEHIFQTLQQVTGTIDETAQRTGRSRKTVQRWVERMGNFVDPLTGEALPLVTPDEEARWKTLPIDLERVARITGTVGRGEHQRAQYARERQAHRNALLRGKQKVTIEEPGAELADE